MESKSLVKLLRRIIREEVQAAVKQVLNEKKISNIVIKNFGFKLTKGQTKILNEIDTLSKEGYFLIVQKYGANNLAFKLEGYKSSEKYSFSIPYIKENFISVEETDFFNIYKIK